MLTSERISRLMFNDLSQEILPGTGSPATVERVYGLAIKSTKKPAHPRLPRTA